MSLPITRFSRRRDIDVARVLIVASLIFFHTARIFDNLDFYVKNDPQEPAVTFIVILTAFWGMPLMFMIAGFAIWHSLQQRTVVAFIRERFQRLCLPFITGLLVIVPPQIYFEISSNPGYQETFTQYYPRFFDITFNADFPWFFSASPATDLFHPAHLWFLYILFVFTLVMLPVFFYLQKPVGQKLVSQMASFSTRPWRIFLLFIPIAVLEAALGTSLSGGWNQLVYGVFLIYGYLFAADSRFRHAIVNYRRISLVLAILISFGGIVGFYIHAGSTGTNPLKAYDFVSVAIRVSKGLVGWCWMVVILGYMEAARDKDQMEMNDPNSVSKLEMSGPSQSLLFRMERYANEAVLPFYIIHQTVIIAIGFYVVRWHTSAILKYLIISFGALTITLLLYETAVKRTRITRFLFGMKSERAS